MSGRDLRTFVNFHRNAIGASGKLVNRNINLSNELSYSKTSYSYCLFKFTRKSKLPVIHNENVRKFYISKICRLIKGSISDPHV